MGVGLSLRLSPFALFTRLRPKLRVYVLARATPRETPVLVSRRREEQGLSLYRPESKRDLDHPGLAVHAHEFDVFQRCRPDIGFLDLPRVASVLLDVRRHSLRGLPAGRLGLAYFLASGLFVAAG